jgi:CubicO group peptidase (beta-lactamase class C family)
MKKIISLSSNAFFAIVLLVGCKTEKPEHSEEFLAIQQELTEKLSTISKEANFNGFGVALVDEKEILYQNGFGIANINTKQPYDQHTIQNIASVSKPVLGIALLKAQEMGKLKLDDTIDQYLSFKIANPNYPEAPVTIRQLATHTSSINDTEAYLDHTILLKDTHDLKRNLQIDISPTKFNPPDARISIEEFCRNVLTTEGKWYRKDNFTEHAPGAIFNYSNVGTTLAALVLEKATGMRYDEFTTQYILKPLEMNTSGWSLNTIDFSKYTQTFDNKTTPYPYYTLNTYPDGGLLTTTDDMSKLISELMKGYLGEGTLLSVDSYREYYKPQLKDENFINRSMSGYSDENNMGITMGFGSTGNFGHTGGDPGLFAVIWFDVKNKTGRYFIINTDWNGDETGKHQKAIYALLDEYTIKLKEALK